MRSTYSADAASAAAADPSRATASGAAPLCIHRTILISNLKKKFLNVNPGKSTAMTAHTINTHAHTCSAVVLSCIVKYESPVRVTSMGHQYESPVRVTSTSHQYVVLSYIVNVINWAISCHGFVLLLRTACPLQRARKLLVSSFALYSL